MGDELEVSQEMERKCEERSESSRMGEGRPELLLLREILFFKGGRHRNMLVYWLRRKVQKGRD